jgi:multisubunit Na+/H+ antiporter MnhE subunit
VTASLRLAVAWVAFVALWLFFVYQPSVSELIAAAATAALTLLSGVVVFRILPVCFEPRLVWLAQVYRLPRMIAEDLWLLFKCLLREITKRPSRSTFALAEFHSKRDGCRAAAQRALALLFVSTTPNSIVLDIDVKRNRMFYHQVEPAPVPELLRRLEE